MQDNQSKPVVRKAYIYLLPLIVVGVILQLIFNSEVRKLVGLRPSKKSVSRKAIDLEEKSPSGELAAEKAFDAKGISAFANYITWFKPQKTELPTNVVVIVEPPTKVVVIVEPPTSEVVIVVSELQTNVVRNVEKLWPFITRGICVGENQEPVAIVDGISVHDGCFKGTRMEPSSTNRCAYVVLHVGERCVWAEACPRAGSLPPVLVHEIKWPAVNKIVREYDEKTGGYVSAKLLFADGKSTRPGQSYNFNGSSMQTLQLSGFLNDKVAVFKMDSGTNELKVVCSVVDM